MWRTIAIGIGHDIVSLSYGERGMLQPLKQNISRRSPVSACSGSCSSPAFHLFLSCYFRAKSACSSLSTAGPGSPSAESHCGSISWKKSPNLDERTIESGNNTADSNAWGNVKTPQVPQFRSVGNSVSHSRLRLTFRVPLPILGLESPSRAGHEQ